MENEVKIINKQVDPLVQLRNEMGKMEDQFKLALPPQIDPQRFTRIVLTAIQQNKDILLADRKSLWGACLKAAADGLLPDGREAALVTYKIKGSPVVQYLPMIAGILKKVRNSGELASITSHIIYKNDEFKFWIDDQGEHIQHNPLLFGDRGERLGAYAVARTKEGSSYIEVMNEKQIDDVRNVSKAKEFGPWAGPFADEMRRKTVLRRLSKRLPMSSDLEQVINRDDDLYDFTPENPKDKGLAAELNSSPAKSIEGDKVQSLEDLSGEVVTVEVKGETFDEMQ